MITIYTYNGNVVKDSTTGKWFTKPSGPEPGPSFDEVTIGTQTWMAKNLAIDDGGTGIYKVYNISANGLDMGTQYFYTWDAAVRVAASIEGWHLPIKGEFSQLISYCGNSATNFTSTTGWNTNHGYNINGTGEYGFNAEPVGVVVDGSYTNEAGHIVDYWTSTEANTVYSWFARLIEDSSSFAIQNYGKSVGRSVRLIKDT